MKLLVFCLLCVIWGFSWVAIKLTLQGFPPFLGAALRFSIALPLLWGYVSLRRSSLRLARSEWKLVAWTSILTYPVDYGLIYWAEQYLNAGVTAVLFATFPIFTALLTRWMIPTERPGWLVFAGLAIGFGGVFISFREEVSYQGGEGPVLWATLGVVAAAVAAAAATLLVKRSLTGLDPATLTFWQMALGALSLFALSLVSGEGLGGVSDGPALVGLLYLGLFASAMAFTLYYWLLRRSSAVTVSTMIFVTPVVALAGDWLVYGRPATTGVVWGAALILLGVAAVELPRYREYLRSYFTRRASAGLGESRLR